MGDEGTGEIKRKGGVKTQKVVVVRGHEFLPTTFKSPTQCCHCKIYVWGISDQGYRCQKCHFSAHKRCHTFVNFDCSSITIAGSTGQQYPHMFASRSFPLPAPCDLCGILVVGAGVQCAGCKFTAHTVCAQHAPALCGHDPAERYGRVNVEITFEQVSPTLVCLDINVLEAANLTPSSGSTANPYLKVTLRPDPEDHRLRKTEPLKKTLNPVFNENFKIVDKEANYDGRVSIEVWDKHSLTSNKLLGCMSFTAEEIKTNSFARVHGWYKLLDLKNGTFLNEPVPEAASCSESTNAATTSHGHSHDAGGHAHDHDDNISLGESPQQSPRKSMFTSTVDVFSAGSLAEFQLLKLVGQSTRSQVFMAEKNGTEAIFALKVVKFETLEAARAAELELGKYMALGAMSSFLVTMYTLFCSESLLCILSEFEYGGSLQFHLQKQGAFSEERCRFYAAEACVALWFLHENGIAHKSVKLENMLLGSDGHLLLSNFGVNRKVSNLPCCAQDYTAPELSSSPDAPLSADWWALGVAIFKMLSGILSHAHSVAPTTVASSLSLMIPPHLSPEAVAVIHAFLASDISSRLGCGDSGRSDVENHAFFTAVVWKTLEARGGDAPFVPTVQARQASNVDPQYADSAPILRL